MSQVPAAAPASAENPGKGLAIVGLVLSFLPFLQLVGLIVSIIAKGKSKKAGFKNGFATAGIIISILGLVITGAVIAASAAGIGAVASQCAELGSGEHVLDNGVTITCG